MGQEGGVCELLWVRSSPLIDASRVNWNGQWEQASSKTVQFCICGSVEHGKVEVYVVRVPRAQENAELRQPEEGIIGRLGLAFGEHQEWVYGIRSAASARCGGIHERSVGEAEGHGAVREEGFER